MEMETSSIRPPTHGASPTSSSAMIVDDGSSKNNKHSNGTNGSLIKSTTTKQVSFRGDVLVPISKDGDNDNDGGGEGHDGDNDNDGGGEGRAFSANKNRHNNNTDSHRTMSDRSTGSVGSRESDLSRETAGTSAPSLGSRLIRTQKNRDPLRYYEVLKVLGDGSMGSVSMVKKRKSAVGGSARKSFVEEEKRGSAVQIFPCLTFCLPGFKERKKRNSDPFVTVVDDSDASESDGVSSAFTEGSGILVHRSEKGGGSSGTGKDETKAHSRTASAVSFASQDEDDNAKASDRARRVSTYKKSTSSMISYGSDLSVTYALKSIILDRAMDSTFRRELLNEIAILRSIDHPNIVRAIETYEHQSRIYLVLELCSGGDLYARDPYTEGQARSITYALLDAIAYLHSKDVTHRDLKYENIMFASPTSPTVKIIDFGLSKKYGNKGKEAMTETVGTVYTMAPEVIKGEYDEKCDVWSIGVIAFMLLSSSLPFYGKTRANVVRKILHGSYGFKGRRWKDISPPALDFIGQTLVQDPALRPSATAAMDADWFEKDTARMGNVLSGHEVVSSAVMDRVQASIQTFGRYSKLKKLALLVIAHKSSDEEIGFLRRLFLQRFDTEKSAANVSYPEFKEALKVYNYADDELVDMFTGIDIDGTGKVSYTEFLAATIEAHGSIEEERIAEAFDRIDCDDSGFITVANLKDLLGEEVSQSFLDDIIDEVDNDGDHSISYDEFLGLWDEKFDGKLRRNLEDVQSRRIRRESMIKVIPFTPEQLFDDDLTEDDVGTTSMDLSEASGDSSAPSSGGFFFAKEKEKSLRGVWI